MLVLYWRDMVAYTSETLLLEMSLGTCYYCSLLQYMWSTAACTPQVILGNTAQVEPGAVLGNPLAHSVPQRPHDIAWTECITQEDYCWEILNYIYIIAYCTFIQSLGQMAERSKALASGASREICVGSNPTLFTILFAFFLFTLWGSLWPRMLVCEDEAGDVRGVVYFAPLLSLWVCFVFNNAMVPRHNIQQCIYTCISHPPDLLENILRYTK